MEKGEKRQISDEQVQLLMELDELYIDQSDWDYDFERSGTARIWATIEIQIRAGDEIKTINWRGQDPFVFEDEKMGWEEIAVVDATTPDELDDLSQAVEGTDDIDDVLQAADEYDAFEEVVIDLDDTDDHSFLTYGEEDIEFFERGEE